jgi:hypothetical protein
MILFVYTGLISMQEMASNCFPSVLDKIRKTGIGQQHGGLNSALRKNLDRRILNNVRDRKSCLEVKQK